MCCREGVRTAALAGYRTTKWDVIASLLKVLSKVGRENHQLQLSAEFVVGSAPVNTLTLTDSSLSGKEGELQIDVKQSQYGSHLPSPPAVMSYHHLVCHYARWRS